MGLQKGGDSKLFFPTFDLDSSSFPPFASTSVHWGNVNLHLTHELSWKLFKMDKKWVRYELVVDQSVCSVMGDSTLLQLWIVFIYKTCKTNEKFEMNAHQSFSPCNLKLLPKWEIEARSWFFLKEYIDFCNFCSLISMSMVEQTSSCLST
jgi:hypothetical protein